MKKDITNALYKLNKLENEFDHDEVMTIVKYLYLCGVSVPYLECVREKKESLESELKVEIIPCYSADQAKALANDKMDVTRKCPAGPWTRITVIVPNTPKETIKSTERFKLGHE